ncbi:hypothetical protein JCM24511_05576 [Saitozyma sp. JCM 24511]|nr:hypothetical protein JCM24511_05576 [Saitozyma sp. JCM 24511]
MPLALSNTLLRELYSGADRYSSDSSASDSEDETPTPSDSSSLGDTSASPRYPLSPSVSRRSLSSSESEDSPAEDLERVPHRLTRLREGVYEALRLALSLVARKGEWEERQGDARDTGRTGARAGALPATVRDEPKRRRLFKRKKRCTGQMLEVHEPWSKLASVLQELKSVLKSFKGDEDEAVRRALAVLTLLVDTVVIPLAGNKTARSSLSRSEARAIPTLLKRWQSLAARLPPFAYGTLSLEEVLSAPPIILLRLAYLALHLSRPLTLDLSHLLIRPEQLEDLDLASLLGLFHYDACDVTHLSLSYNDLSVFPSWFPFPFPSLEVLDVSLNHLSCLPISLFKLRALRRLRIRRTRLDKNLPSIRIVHPARWIAQSAIAHPDKLPSSRQLGAKSLLEIVLGLLLDYVLLPEELAALPTHLAKLVEDSYRCDLCRRLIMAPQSRSATETPQAATPTPAGTSSSRSNVPGAGEAGKGHAQGGWMAEPVELTWAVQMEMHWDGIFLGRGSGGAAVKEGLQRSIAFFRAKERGPLIPSALVRLPVALALAVIVVSGIRSITARLPFEILLHQAKNHLPIRRAESVPQALTASQKVGVDDHLSVAFGQIFQGDEYDFLAFERDVAVVVALSLSPSNTFTCSLVSLSDLLFVPDGPHRLRQQLAQRRPLISGPGPMPHGPERNLHPWCPTTMTLLIAIRPPLKIIVPQHLATPDRRRLYVELQIRLESRQGAQMGRMDDDDVLANRHFLDYVDHVVGCHAAVYLDLDLARSASLVAPSSVRPPLNEVSGRSAQTGRDGVFVCPSTVD